MTYKSPIHKPVYKYNQTSATTQGGRSTKYEAQSIKYNQTSAYYQATGGDV